MTLAAAAAPFSDVGLNSKQAGRVDILCRCGGAISRRHFETRRSSNEVARWLQDDDGGDEVALHSSVLPSVRLGPC